ncbi:MAG: DUF2924 domain-containing protein [Sphingomonadales bacterium]|nr:DUF2924 domain-containing protein [Sphingomonadales bacterium]
MRGSCRSRCPAACPAWPNGPSTNAQDWGRKNVRSTRLASSPARLVRRWQDVTYDVLVTEDGYLFKEKVFGLLSAIAEAITGTHWSGPRFFGLADRGRVGHGRKR